MRVKTTILPALAVLLLLAPASVAREKKKKDPIPRAKQTAEFKYLDAPDAETAAARLPALLKKYAGEKGCLKLRKILRDKRRYPRRVPDRLTWKHECIDGKVREVTWIAGSKRSKRKKPGVLVFLHGAVRQPPPGGGANEASMFAPAFKDLNVIMVGPSTYEGQGWDKPACRELVHHALRVVLQTFDVDENRIYLAGDSDGGRGTYCILETEASAFASAVPVIGAPGSVTRFANLRNVPLFAINGEKDSIFDIANVRRLVEGMKASGIDLTYKEIEGGGHNPRFFLEYRDEICDFLGKHPRDPFPEVVTWEIDPGREQAGDAYPIDTFRWVRVLETGTTASRGEFARTAGSLIRGDFPRIEARRSGNQIEVKTRNVKRYAILVSPDMLDLAEDIVITTNGRPSWKGTVTPDSRVLLEEARRTLDRRLLFTARIEVDVDG